MCWWDPALKKIQTLHSVFVPCAVCWFRTSEKECVPHHSFLSVWKNWDPDSDDLRLTVTTRQLFPCLLPWQLKRECENWWPLFEQSGAIISHLACFQPATILLSPIMIIYNTGSVWALAVCGRSQPDSLKRAPHSDTSLSLFTCLDLVTVVREWGIQSLRCVRPGCEAAAYWSDNARKALLAMLGTSVSCPKFLGPPREKNGCVVVRTLSNGSSSEGTHQVVLIMTGLSDDISAATQTGWAWMPTLSFPRLKRQKLPLCCFPGQEIHS